MNSGDWVAILESIVGLLGQERIDSMIATREGVRTVVTLKLITL